MVDLDAVNTQHGDEAGRGVAMAGVRSMGALLEDTADVYPGHGVGEEGGAVGVGGFGAEASQGWGWD